MDKVEEEWGFEELKIVRELAMGAIDREDRVVEVFFGFYSRQVCFELVFGTNENICYSQNKLLTSNFVG